MIGSRYGRWTVLSEHPTRQNRKRMFLCRCDCGTVSVVASGNLKSGISKSCGCYGRERTHEAKFMHGRNSSDRTYRIWSAMRARCNDKSHVNYPRYGGRGIKVCERWNDFRVFLLDMGEAPLGLSIDRIDNNCDYEPENCRWTTTEEQSRNRSDNRFIEYCGKRMCVVDWEKNLGLKKGVISKRLWRGWTEKEAIEG